MVNPLILAFESASMNIEQAVIENLRLLPRERQQDVLVFIHYYHPSQKLKLKQ